MANQLDNKNYISGIYNYCDRWCEKCSFTANCLLFTNESKIITHEILNNGDMSGLKDVLYNDPDSDENDFSNEFFDDEPLFDDDENDEEFRTEYDGEEPPQHILEILSDEFFDKSHQFLNSLNEKFNLYPPPQEKLLDPRFNRIFNNFEVVSWYHTFIGAKVRRALLGKTDLLEEADEDEETREFTQQDIDGSAKVAVLGIRSSISSLQQLYKELPDYHEKISELMVIAGKLLNETETEFPGYKDFKRPGFDD